MARSRWPGAPLLVTRSSWPGRLVLARWPGPGPGYLRRLWPCPVPPVPVPVPVHVCPAGLVLVAVFEGMDAQSLPGIWLFSKPLVRGKQYCEVRTIIRQKQEPNGCQSQVFDMKTLGIGSLAPVFLERLCSRCCLPGVRFLELF